MHGSFLVFLALSCLCARLCCSSAPRKDDQVRALSVALAYALPARTLYTCVCVCVCVCVHVCVCVLHGHVHARSGRVQGAVAVIALQTRNGAVQQQVVYRPGSQVLACEAVPPALAS